jgi:hypothetical protein
VIGRFDDARPRRVGVRHVDGEKLRGRAYAEERHFIYFPFVRSFVVMCVCVRFMWMVYLALLECVRGGEERALE